MCFILSFTPFDLVDFLLDLQGLEIIEFWFMRLKFGVEFVLAALFLCRKGAKQAKLSTSAGLDELIALVD